MNKKFFLYVAATAALVSCSDDLQLQQAETVATMDGVQAKLVKAGFIGGSKAVDETRAFTGLGNFVWMSTSVDPTNGKVQDLDLDGNPDYPQIGLCWTGFNPNSPELGMAPTQGDVTANVYTNYLYEQVGWLRWGDTELWYDECKENEIINGAFYIGFDASATHDAYFGGSWNPDLSEKKEYAYGGHSGTGLSSRYNKYYYSEGSDQVKGQFHYKNPYTLEDNDPEDLNLGAGIFKTENSSVFEGQYIVYFPYNPDFKKGPIMARVADHFQMNVGDDKYAVVSENAFQLGVMQNYGGVVSGKNREANFTTQNYSATMQVNLMNTAYASKNKVRAVMLYSSKDGIVYEAGIDANSVVTAKKADGTLDMSKIKQVPGTQSHYHSVYTYLSDDDHSHPEYVEVLTSQHAMKDRAVKVPFPVLPCTVSDLQVIVMFDDYSTVITDKQEVEFKAGKPEMLYVDLASASNNTTVLNVKDNGYIAVDEPSLVNAATSIYGKDIASKIKVVRPIDLIKDNDALYKAINGGTNADGMLLYKNDLLITGNEGILCEACKNAAKLVVKTETERFVESDNSLATLTFDLPVIVEGWGCCAPVPATLNLGGNKSGKDNITFTTDHNNANMPAHGKLTNYGYTNVGGANSLAVVNFAEVENYFDDVKHANEAEAYVKQVNPTTQGLATWKRAKGVPTITINNGYTTTVQKTKIDGDLTTEGLVVVEAANAAADANGFGLRSELLTVTGNVINNGLRAYDFTNKVEKPVAETLADVAGGRINSLNNAVIVVNGYVENNNDIAIIYTEGDGHSDTTDGRIDIKTAGKSVNTGTVDNAGVINLTNGNFDNSKGLFIDQQTGQVGGIPVNNGSAVSRAKELADYDNNQYYLYGVHNQKLYKTDIKTGIYCAQAETTSRLAFIVNDPVIDKSTVMIEIIKDGLVVDFNAADFKGKDFVGKDVRVSANNVKFRNMHATAGVADGVSCLGHCLDVDADGCEIARFAEAQIENNVIVEADHDLTTNNYNYATTIGWNLFVEDAANANFNKFDQGSLFGMTPDEAKLANLTVKNDIRLDATTDAANPAKLTANKTYLVGQDVIVAAKSFFDSYSDNNEVNRHWQLYGLADFDYYTTTTIWDTFNSYSGSKITRKGLEGHPESRATVNCTTLGKTSGAAIGGWPTEFVK